MTKGRVATEAERKLVRAMVRRWLETYYLQALTVRLEWMTDTIDNEDGTTAAILAHAANSHHIADIRIYPEFFLDLSRSEQDLTIAHELAHVITAPLDKMIDRLRAGELVTPGEQEEADECATDLIARIAYYGGKSPHAKPAKRKPNR